MITGYIKGQNLTIRTPMIAADTIDYLTAQFVFQTVDWEGCRLFSHWKCGETNYTIELSDAGKIEKEQHLNLTAGTWTVWIHGERYRDGELIQRITTDEATLTVTATGTAGGSPFPEVPASDLERINAEIAELQDKVGSGGGDASGKADKPVTITVELAEDNSFVIPDHTRDALEEMARNGEVRLLGARANEGGSAVILMANINDSGSSSGTLYTVVSDFTASSLPVIVLLNDGESGATGTLIEAPAEGTGTSSGGVSGIMAVAVPIAVPCENYPAKYYRLLGGGAGEELSYAQVEEAWLAGNLTLTIATDMGADEGSMYGVLRPVAKSVLAQTLDFLGVYWVEGDATVARGMIPLTATIKPDGTITIKEAEDESGMLYLLAPGELPGVSKYVYDRSLTQWTAAMLWNRTAIARRPVMLTVFQDELDTEDGTGDITARRGNFRLIEVSGGSSGAAAATFHGEYWDDGTSAWIPAVAVMDADGKVTVTDASWAEVDSLSKAIGNKLDADKLPEAINTALAQAKESGEFDGEDGQDGKDGTSVTVQSVSESTESGGNNVVTFSDGKTLTVKNGKDGQDGAPGGGGSGGSDGGELFTVTAEGGESWIGFTLEELGISSVGDIKAIMLEGRHLWYLSPDGTVSGAQEIFAKIKAENSAAYGLIVPRLKVAMLYVDGLAEPKNRFITNKCELIKQANLNTTGEWTSTALLDAIGNNSNESADKTTKTYFPPSAYTWYGQTGIWLGFSNQSLTWASGAEFNVRIWKW